MNISEKIEATIRDLAVANTWVEKNPDIEVSLWGTELTIYAPSTSDPEQEKRNAAKIVRAMSKGQPIGSVKKITSENYQTYELGFGESKVQLTFTVARNVVCRKVVVGTEVVMVADPDAPKIEQIRDVIEWECDPLLQAVEA